MAHERCKAPRNSTSSTSDPLLSLACTQMEMQSDGEQIGPGAITTVTHPLQHVDESTAGLFQTHSAQRSGACPSAGSGQSQAASGPQTCGSACRQGRASLRVGKRPGPEAHATTHGGLHQSLTTPSLPSKFGNTGQGGEEGGGESTNLKTS